MIVMGVLGFHGYVCAKADVETPKISAAVKRKMRRIVSSPRTGAMRIHLSVAAKLIAVHSNQREVALPPLRFAGTVLEKTENF
jgi:hypothetical protein